MHLGPQNLHVGPNFHRSAGPFTILLFYYLISIASQAGGFCISGRKTSMSARHFHWSAGLFTILLFYYFISIASQAGGLCISGRKTCMSACHFHWSAGPLTVLLIRFHWGRRILHLGPQNLHVRSRFFACQAANPTRPPHAIISQVFCCISDRQSCMSAHVFACRPILSP